ncbi:MAG: hypothetical protein ACK5LC_09400 [Coprobacillaceae bacterium]
MRNNLKSISISFFIAAIPLFMIVDWYYPRFGLIVLFLSITCGLVVDQLHRIFNTTNMVERQSLQYKYFRLGALILFVQSPIAIIYENMYRSGFGTIIAALMIVLGIILDQISRMKERQI